MNPEKKIIRIMKHAPVFPVDEKLRLLLESQISLPVSKTPGTSDTIHRRKALIVSVSVAAILVLVFLGQSFLHLSGTAYGIGDLPGILKRSKTMHIAGRGYFPGKSGGRGRLTALELDYWFDCANGRYYLRKPAGFDPQTGRPNYFITVSDGRYIMEEVHERTGYGEPRKLMRYIKVSPYQARLDAYRNSYRFIMGLYSGAERLKGSVKEGKEVIGGVAYTIWRTEWTESDGGMTRIRTWLSDQTGVIGKIIFHTKTGDAAIWTPYLTLDSIEMDAVPPERIFETAPPEGYELLNSRENAPLGELGIGIVTSGCREYNLFLHIGFTLPDGSVLVAWSCRKANDAFDALFLGLNPGGPLPSLPGVIESLETIPENAGLRYEGKHLLFTKKNGIFYEWALYVPNRKPPERESFTAYKTNTRFNIERTQFKTFPAKLSSDLSIDSDAEFSTWVAGALCELSDPESIPTGLSLSYLLKLTKKKQAFPK